MELPAKPTILRVTPDHRVAIMVLRDETSEISQRAIVLELSTLAAPAVRSNFSIQGHVEQLEISPDGATTVFLVDRKNSKSAPRWGIVAMDLANPGKPVERWRHELSTYQPLTKEQVSITSDASVYAVSDDAHVLVQKVGSDQDPLEVPILSTQPTLKFSPNGRYLAFVANSTVPVSMGVVDLSSPTPSISKRTGYDRQQSLCVFAVLNSGHLLLGDPMAHRVGIYTPIDGIPRAAAFEGDIDCTDLEVNTLGAGSLTYATAYGIERIDIGNPRKPRATLRWVVPVGEVPLAIAGDLLFAANQNSASLEIYHLRASVDGSTDFNWGALKDADLKAMSAYNQSTEELGVREGKVIAALEESGARQAVQLPVVGISPKEAAAILNDYGYFASVTRFDFQRAEASLRRAIALDPELGVAYLNLANVRRRRLSEIGGIKNWQSAMNEISDLYRTYVGKGGKSTPEIDRFVRAVAFQQGTMPFCEAVATSANDGTLEDLIVDRALGVEVRGGRHADISFSTDGSEARNPIMEALESHTQSPMELEVNGWADGLTGADALGLLFYGGVAHVIQYRGAKYPIRTAPLLTGPACEFSSTTTEIVAPKALEPALCHGIVDADATVNSIEFPEPVQISRGVLEKRYRETSAVGEALVDFANTGVPKKVVALALSSGRGEGCEEQFFDVVSESGDRLAEGTDHDLIAQLQRFTGGIFPLDCGNAAKFFTYHGKTYFENTPAAGPMDSRNEYHSVTRVEQGKVSDVCGITFQTHVSPRDLMQP
jgi:hypothetical protein